MNAMIETYRSSVQSWEIDMMGHMNVKFYVEKSTAALALMAQRLGVGPEYTREVGARLVPLEHHIRFLQEQRPGAPVFMRAGILESRGDTVTVYQELVNAATGAVAATFMVPAALRRIRDREPVALPDSVHTAARALVVDLPAHGEARGLTLDAPRQAPSLDEAEAAGMLATWQGPVLPRTADADGYLAPESHMGIVSDSIPNLLVHLTTEDRSSSDLGGAALEYRFVYRKPAAIGDLLALRSGIKSVGGKTYQFGHWLFDSVSGEAVATAEAVAVMFDLEARKAVTIPEDRRAILERHVIPGLSA